jgi:hypothetical protein
MTDSDIPIALETTFQVSIAQRFLSSFEKTRLVATDAIQQRSHWTDANGHTCRRLSRISDWGVFACLTPAIWNGPTQGYLKFLSAMAA